MLSSKDLIGILHDFVWDIMFYFFSIYFVNTCFFVDKYLRDIVYLEKLIYMRDDTSSIDISICGSPSFYSCLILWWLRKEFAYECLFYFIVSSRTHIWVRHKLWSLVCILLSLCSFLLFIWYLLWIMCVVWLC